jgi:CRISPR-associated protein Csb1
VFAHRDPAQEWTADAAEARLEKNEPAPFSRKGAGDKGTPAAINHGNIPPSIEADAGGVTMSHAVQTTVISLAGLRRLRFSTTVDGDALPTERRDAAERAARTALAALALAAIAYQRENGYDLRSRSLLVATEPLAFEILGRDGGEPQRYWLERDDVRRLVADAQAEQKALGLGWDREPVTLRPAPKLAELVRRSRALKQAGADEEGA